MSIVPSKNSVVFRRPSNKTVKLNLHNGLETISYSAKPETAGQWLVYQPDSQQLRMFGIHNTSRMERVGNTLLFSSSLDDVGEEFSVLVYSGGILVVRIVLSPEKCPIDHYHQYVLGYVRLLGYPEPGAKVIGGGSGEEGRVPTQDELTFRLMTDAVEILRNTSSVEQDISKHDRGYGGEAGIDAIKTLDAWKTHPSWYSTSKTPQKNSLRLGEYYVTPLRVAPRNALGTNMFIGSITTALEQTLKKVPRTASGNVAGLALELSKRKLQSLDRGTQMSMDDAWMYLMSKHHPPASERLLMSLIRFSEAITKEQPHCPRKEGTSPYYLFPPELIFQWFAVSMCLLALGLSDNNLPDALEKIKGAEGLSVNKFQIWADTSAHGIRGWRDSTESPSKYKPDLVVRNTETQDVLLIDAKFRRSGTQDHILSSSSIKDIQAYMQEYNQSRAAIIVPYIEEDPPSEDLKADGFWIRGIPLAPTTTSQNRNLLESLLSELWGSETL